MPRKNPSGTSKATLATMRTTTPLDRNRLKRNEKLKPNTVYRAMITMNTVIHRRPEASLIRPARKPPQPAEASKLNTTVL